MLTDVAMGLLSFLFLPELTDSRVFFLCARLQREEEEAYSSTQRPQGAQSLTFTKFEEKKTNEKSRKVTTVKKFFGASSRAGAKKGNGASLVQQSFASGYLANPHLFL